MLYIDDDPAILDLAKIYLEMSRNLRIDTTTSVREALGKINQQKYDGIISDYEMPEINGIEFLRYIRLHYRDLPFILFTGRAGKRSPLKPSTAVPISISRKAGSRSHSSSNLNRES